MGATIRLDNGNLIVFVQFVSWAIVTDNVHRVRLMPRKQ